MSDYPGLPDWIRKAAREIQTRQSRHANVICCCVQCESSIAEVIARNVQPSPLNTDRKSLAEKYAHEYAFNLHPDESALMALFLRFANECTSGNVQPSPDAELGALNNRIHELETDLGHTITLWKQEKHRADQSLATAKKSVIGEIMTSTGPTGGWLDSPKAVCASIVERISCIMQDEQAEPFDAESRPVQQPAKIIAAQQAEDEGLWCIPQTVMEAHLQKELRRLTEAVEGKTSAECLRELLLKSRVQQPAPGSELTERIRNNQRDDSQAEPFAVECVCPTCGSNSAKMPWCSVAEHGKNVHAFIRHECARCVDPWHVPQPATEPTKEFVPSNSCNRHSDCAAAVENFKRNNSGKTPGFNFHCHDEDCEDCFGC